MIVIEPEASFPSEAKRQSQPRKSKRQYSAGFRNFGGKHINQHRDTSSILKGSSNEQMMRLLDELSVGNISKLYRQNLPPTRCDNKEQIQEAVARLSKPQIRSIVDSDGNGIDQSGDDGQSVSSSCSQTKEEIAARRFKSIYHLDDTYGQKASKKLKLRQKQHHEQVLKRSYQQHQKVLENSKTFQIVLLKFIFCRLQYLKSVDCPFTSDKLGNQFKNFIINFRMQDKRLKKSIDKVSVRDLEAIGRRSLYLYCFLRIGQFGERSLAEGITFDSMLNQHIGGQGLLEPTDQLLQDYTEIRKFTIPYHLGRYQASQKQIIQEQQPEKFHYKANPIPKNLFQSLKPKEKKQFNQTESKPFSFVGKKTKKMTPEEYYHWNTSFKAKNIPESTYQIDTPLYNREINQKMIQERARQQLQKAFYPENMKYLTNLKQHREQRNLIIQEKYSRPFSAIHSKSIPDFHRQHVKGIMQLEVKKEGNQVTKSKPFKFHETKRQRSVDATAIVQLQELARMNEGPRIAYEVKPPKVKATLKYQAYVDFRKNLKDKLVLEKQRAQGQQKQKARKQEPYKDILLNRMKNQLSNSGDGRHPQPFGKPQQNSVKLDLQAVYSQKPLLMESKGSNCGKSTPYTSLYEPII